MPAHCRNVPRPSSFVRSGSVHFFCSGMVILFSESYFCVLRTAKIWYCERVKTAHHPRLEHLRRACLNQHELLAAFIPFVIAQLGLCPFSLSPSWAFALFRYRPVGSLPFFVIAQLGLCPFFRQFIAQLVASRSSHVI